MRRLTAASADARALSIGRALGWTTRWGAPASRGRLPNLTDSPARGRVKGAVAGARRDRPGVERAGIVPVARACADGPLRPREPAGNAPVARTLANRVWACVPTRVFANARAFGHSGPVALAGFVALAAVLGDIPGVALAREVAEAAVELAADARALPHGAPVAGARSEPLAGVLGDGPRVA